MIFNETYFLNLKINNKIIDINESDLSFEIHSSINSFYNNCILKIKDKTGFLRENLLFVEGMLYEISFGFKDNFLTCQYVVESDETKEQERNDTISLPTTLNLINSFYSKEEIKSEAFNNKISKIVENIFSQELFKLNIEETSNKKNWYRALQTQKDFIEGLSKKATPSGDDSPYYCFFNLDNSFNFVSYNYLNSQTSQIVLNGYNQSSTDINLNTIFQIKEFKQGSLKTKQFWKRKVYSRNLENGEYFEKDFNIENCPKEVSSSIPIVCDHGLYTGYINTEFEKDLSYNKSIVNYGMKNTFFLDRYIITTLFNPNIVAGKKITLNLNYSENVYETKKANFLSGNYIVEDCIHSWDGERKKAFTTIIVGRKFANVPNNYTIKDNLINV
jgi:hypothetical protein